MKHWLQMALRVPLSTVLTVALALGCPVLLGIQALALSRELEVVAQSMFYRREAMALGMQLCLALGGLGTLALAWRCRRGVGWLFSLGSWRPIVYWLLGLFVAVGGGSWIFGTIAYRDWDVTNIQFDSLLLAVWGLWMVGLVCWERRLVRRPRLFRLERLAGVMLTAIILVEFALTSYDYWRFSTAFLYNTRAQEIFANFRETLRHDFFGYPFNSDGYYDKEFYVSGEDDCVVAWIADSFGMGIVPYPWNVTTVAEERLQDAWGDQCTRTDVFNFGVPKMGMKGYVQVATFETPEYKPDLTVLCVFVGNDIFTADATIFVHSFVQNWRLYMFFKRQFVPYARPEASIKLPQGRDPALPATIDAMGPEDHPPPLPFILDPTLEEPHLPEALYWRRQGERLSYFQPANPNIPKHYRLFFAALDHMREVVQGPLLLVIAPDELQVDDAVWEQLMATRDEKAYVRDLPQRRILDYCQRVGLPAVDLLPTMRAAHEREGNVYHYRDTHWNARGNRVAGEAVAVAIVELLAVPKIGKQ